MHEISVVTKESVFEQGTVSITVLNAEHHGKCQFHTHPFFELVYIDNGFSIHSCDGKNTVLTAGDLFLLKPGQAHSYVKAHHTRLYNCLFMLDELSCLADDIFRLPVFTRFLQDKTAIWESVHLDPSGRQELLFYLDKMKWERKHKPLHWEFRLKILIVEILVLYARLCENKTKNGEQDESMKYIYQALQYVENNCGNRLSVVAAAAASGVSADYLSRQFHSMLGITMIDYIKNYRIVKAMELLKQTTMSVAEVAQQVGVGNLSHFSRQFKQVAGVSPLRFRKGI